MTPLFPDCLFYLDDRSFGEEIVFPGRGDHQVPMLYPSAGCKSQLQSIATIELQEHDTPLPGPQPQSLVISAKRDLTFVHYVAQTHITISLLCITCTLIVPGMAEESVGRFISVGAQPLYLREEHALSTESVLQAGNRAQTKTHLGSI